MLNQHNCFHIYIYTKYLFSWPTTQNTIKSRREPVLGRPSPRACFAVKCILALSALSPCSLAAPARVWGSILGSLGVTSFVCLCPHIPTQMPPKVTETFGSPLPFLDVYNVLAFFLCLGLHIATQMACRDGGSSPLEE